MKKDQLTRLLQSSESLLRAIANIHDLYRKEREVEPDGSLRPLDFSEEQCLVKLRQEFERFCDVIFPLKVAGELGAIAGLNNALEIEGFETGLELLESYAFSSVLFAESNILSKEKRLDDLPSIEKIRIAIGLEIRKLETLRLVPDREATAIGLLAKDSTITKKEIAERLGADRRVLGADRMPDFNKAWRFSKSKKDPTARSVADQSSI